MSPKPTRRSIMENVIVIDEAIVRAMVEARDAGKLAVALRILPSWVP